MYLDLVRVYPRTCGGTRIDPPGWTSHGGLSPHVRGNPIPWSSAWRGPRSIPARAGEPYRLLLLLAGPRVYPRTCGGT